MDVVTESWTTIDVGDSSMRTYVCAPGARYSRHAGVVMIHGGFGLDAGGTKMARRICLTGYTVVAPDMFHRLGAEAAAEGVMERLKRLTWEDAQQDIQASLDYLVRDSDVPPDRLSVLGFCMGGALAWMAAATLPVQTAILFYPHELFGPFGEGGPVPFDFTDRIRIPILGHFGADDKNPSPADVERLAEALTRRDVPHQFFQYQGAGHGFAGARPASHRPIPESMATDRTVGWLDRQIQEYAPSLAARRQSPGPA